MSKIRMPVGIENFEELRHQSGYYIDKTELIHNLVQNRFYKAVLFTRPRRFGKTLTMRMLDSFFSIRKDSREIFRGLAVAQHADTCCQWMNQYPTLFLSLKDVVHLTFDKAYGHLQIVIADVCKDFAFLEDSDRVNTADKEIFHDLMFGCGTVSHVEHSLKLLTRMLFMHYQKPVILLIDEYDVPIANAQEHGFYTEMLSVIRNMLSIVLKTNDYLKFAVLTGCLRISKESIFTGVNHFVSYTVLDQAFSGSFGFTGAEIEKLLADTGLEEKMAEIREWYDGYIFGNHEIYCPWDVVNYVNDMQADRMQKPKNYWVNTSRNGILQNFIGHEEWNVHDKFEILLNDGCIWQNVSAELTYDHLESREDSLWSVLLMTGYLTKADHTSGEMIPLKIPNKEIGSIFETAVVRRFQEDLDRSRQKRLMEALWSGNAVQAAEIISDFLFDTISYHDYHEDFYHAFLTGIFQGIGCAVDSNREYGLGRTDIVIKDRKHRRAVLIEAKKAASEASMERTCEKGIEQILTRKYEEGINRGYKEVLCYSIAFFQKQCTVKTLEQLTHTD